jgi:hypothetical protein
MKAIAQVTGTKKPRKGKGFSYLSFSIEQTCPNFHSEGVSELPFWKTMSPHLPQI